MARGKSRDVEAALDSHNAGPTLLPAPVAHAVSLATRSTSLAIRVGALVGTYSLDAARFTTLSSLELARGVVESVLSRAASDSLAQSTSKLAAADAETVLERSLESLHFAVSQAVFWTAAGFRFTGTTIAVASGASQLVLSSLDQLFGSTDSSRAVASIITLVRREFNNPATGERSERVGVVDLVLALGGLAYLQQACWRSPAEEQRRQAYEEIIWDVVVLNDGERVDVQDIDAAGSDPLSTSEVVKPGHDQHDAEDDEAVLAHMKNQIASSLTPGTTVSISNSVSSIQTITVDVEGPNLPSLPTPPGAEIVETRGPSPASESRRPWTPRGQGRELSYRVVYRIERDKFRATSFRSEVEGSEPVVVELADDGPSSPPQIEPAPAPYDGPLAYSHSSPASLANLAPGAESAVLESPPSSSPPSSSAIKVPDTADVDGGSKLQRPSQPVGSSPAEPTANQKKQRLPLMGTSSRDNVRPVSDTGKRSLSKKKGESALPSKHTDKRSALKQALKGGGQSLSNIWNKESTSPEASRTSSKPKPQWKTPSTGSVPSDPAASRPKPPIERSHTQPTHQSLASRRSMQTPEPVRRSSSRASYVSIHESRRDSIVSQTDAYSIHSNGEMRPASPSIVRTDYSVQESTSRPRSGVYSATSVPPSPQKGHRRSTSYVPSLYSLATNDSQSSLILSSYYQKSAYNASNALSTLRREGFVDGTFPTGHLLPNIARYMRFSSACYGSHFLKFMGISTEPPTLGVWDGTHHDVRHFLHHTESEAGNILLASFVDPQGGADASGSTGTGVPLVHYISLDHEAKAVVLACRGTLGFEDVMADMACDYDDMIWRGRRYQVHKGIHASARRLLYGDDGRVLVTIKEALREFPDYGLVLCGHSLGGAVTSLLGVMLAQPNPDGPGFVISVEPHVRLLRPTVAATDARSGDIRLPSGRRIHVYAYGPPGVMSPPLRKITRGLITSVVHGNDIVPHLSLGLLHDLQGLALAFKTDDGSRTRAEIRTRVWHALQAGLADKWHPQRRPSAPPPPPSRGADEQWVLPALAALRGSMTNARLVPPGEVFAIESTRVLRRDAFVSPDDGPVGRPAQRVVLKYVRDVEARFGEVRFGTGMLTDHSPGKYEDALNKLRLGVVE